MRKVFAFMPWRNRWVFVGFAIVVVLLSLLCIDVADRRSNLGDAIAAPLFLAAWILVFVTAATKREIWRNEVDARHLWGRAGLVCYLVSILATASVFILDPQGESFAASALYLVLFSGLAGAPLSYGLAKAVSDREHG